MRRLVFVVLALVVVGASIFGGVWLWGHRPWRTALSVNGRVLTASELELRARTLLDDARRVNHLAIARGHEGEALESFRKEAVKMWIVKEVLLGEAVMRGFSVTSADEKEGLAQAEARLKSRKLTAESFFKEGPLPEEIKRRDFREGILVNKFTQSEIRDKINVTPQEINERMTMLKKLAQREGEKAKIKTDRKTAIDMLRAERFRKEFRLLFRSLFGKAVVKCPEFPELEKLDAISPPRPEDGKDPISGGCAK